MTSSSSYLIPCGAALCRVFFRQGNTRHLRELYGVRITEYGTLLVLRGSRCYLFVDAKLISITEELYSVKTDLDSPPRQPKLVWWG